MSLTSSDGRVTVTRSPLPISYSQYDHAIVMPRRDQNAPVYQIGEGHYYRRDAETRRKLRNRGTLSPPSLGGGFSFRSDAPNCYSRPKESRWTPRNNLSIASAPSAAGRPCPMSSPASAA